MNSLSLGISPCPNDVFIWSGILLGRVRVPETNLTVHFRDVEALNDAAVRGELDILKISAAAMPLVRDNYALIEAGGALGHGCGPLLLTHSDAFHPDREVLVPGERTTANVLLDFWLSMTVQKSFLPFDELYLRLMHEPGCQGVVIHEKRFTYKQDNLNLVCDLGAHWETVTGFPIPLGVTVVRQGVDGAAVTTAIRESLAWAREHEGAALELCALYAADMSPDVMREHVDLYVNEFTDDIGPSGHAALDVLLHRAAPVEAA